MKFLREKLKLPLLQHAKLMRTNKKEGKYKKVHSFFREPFLEREEGKHRYLEEVGSPSFIYSWFLDLLFLSCSHPKT